MANLNNREDKIVRTHIKMVKVYDKYRSDFFNKHGVELSNVEITKKIAEKIQLKGGVLV